MVDTPNQTEDLGIFWERACDDLMKSSTDHPNNPEYWIGRRRKEWLELMIPRVRKYSKEHEALIEIPSPAFHGSPYHGTRELDPSLGQGLGVWFQHDLVAAAEFAVMRCRYLDSATPVVYEAEIVPHRTAVFPTEIAAYNMRIIEAMDDREMYFGEPNSLHEVREVLGSMGFDSIYLLDGKTFSAIDSSIIKIKNEHKALPIFNENTRPVIERRLGKQFEQTFPFLSKLSL